MNPFLNKYFTHVKRHKKSLFLLCQSYTKYTSTLSASVTESIKSIFGANNYSLSESVRLHHAKDESLHPWACSFLLTLCTVEMRTEWVFGVYLFGREAAPDAVVYPENVEQISKLLRLCNKERIPVIPFGAGSGFEGGINAIKVIEISF